MSHRALKISMRTRR